VRGGTQVTFAFVESDFGVRTCNGEAMGNPKGIGGSHATRVGTKLKWTIATPIVSGTVTFSPVASYNRASSLRDISGSWTNLSGTGGVGHVSANGTFIDYEPLIRCTFEGRYTVINPARSLYIFTETVSGCDSFTGGLNGLKLEGVATIGGSGASRTLTRQAAWGTASVADGSGYSGLYVGY
jgi:hypothetical protein